MASAIYVLDGVRGSAGEQRLQRYESALAKASTLPLERAPEEALAEFTLAHGKMIPGFGHRFHPVDPRSVRLLALTDDAQ